MPLYEYECQECGHHFETLVFAGEQPECPQCHTTQLRRAMSLPAAPPQSSSLPRACTSSGPPCGPVCARWGQNN
ncbi:MAG: zinc ribbon domain-containing protein [Gemmataceae bacterium]